ncbi:MAG TPA: threonyl-tRNA synthetase editing domain-containing protein, partial [Candidatus Pacearchaeota archaeon]|nr:threonyl-tRNA synthetase editing domain-containing protein [Candidatus Pacearchaeota archaeon]
MKILSLHCDYIKFKALKKALKEPEELSETDKKEKIVKEALVILTAVEKGDSSAKELVENIKDLEKQVKAENVVLYPYAHLSPNLSSPDVAVEILKQAEKELVKAKLFKQVVRAPFGYYKEFELKCKGHPLSELSRSFGVQSDAKVSTDVKVAVVPKDEPIDYKQLLREISKTKLDTSKLKDNDHRIVGKQLDLFSFSDVAPGMVFWHNNGLIVYNALVDFWREEHQKAGYQEIRTPQIMDAKLWKVSGHWDKYKENNFITNYENRPFLVKPMNCPGGMLVYKNSPKSYKDLPLRVGEIGTVHRCELSGTLAGLFRVIQFTQDDAHIFCADEKQVKSEILGVMDLIKIIYKKFDLDFDHIELSTRPEKRIGADSIWDMAEKILEEVLKESKVKYQINKADEIGCEAFCF